jgi:hypothetical protein
MLRPALVLLLCSLARLSRADFFVYGLFLDYLAPLNSGQIKQIYSKCFSGLNIFTCSPTLPEDDVVLYYDRASYRDLASKQGSAWCLECCGTNPEKVDVWDLTCPVDVVTKIQVNRFGVELFLARNKFIGDTAYVMCPLKRSVCTYDEVTGETLMCDRSLSDKYLHGYTVYVTVQQYDGNFEFWRGVSKCEIESWETDTPLLGMCHMYHMYRRI